VKMKNSPSAFRKYLLLFTRLAIGGVFIAASIDKIAHPAEFAKIVHNYQILPDSLINIAAIVLPWMEALLGVLIIAGTWLPGAVVLANLLLLAFFSALMYNVARGLNVHCGCFSTTVSGAPQTAWYIARDSLILLLGLAFAAQVFGRKPRTYRDTP
jgi:uncharacterized membrane protein YphA (DoxX/SURF4 family)